MDRGNDLPRRRDNETPELFRRQQSSPAVEDLHRVSAGVELCDQVRGRRIAQPRNDRIEHGRIVVCERLRLDELRPAAAIDDIRCNRPDRKSTRLNSSHPSISYAVFCLKKKKKKI